MLELLSPVVPKPHVGYIPHYVGYTARAWGHQGFEKLLAPLSFGASARLGFESVFKSSTQRFQVYCSGKHLLKFFFNDAAKHQPMWNQHPALPAPQTVSALTSRHSCLQSHPHLTLLRHIPGKHLPMAPAFPALHRSTGAAAEVVMIHEPVGPAAGWPGCLADPGVQAAAPASLCPSQAPNEKAKLSQPTQGRAKNWHPFTAPQRLIKGPGKRAEQSVVPRWLLGGVGVKQGLLAISRVFWV